MSESRCTTRNSDSRENRAGIPTVRQSGSRVRPGLRLSSYCCYRLKASRGKEEEESDDAISAATSKMNDYYGIFAWAREEEDAELRASEDGSGDEGQQQKQKQKQQQLPRRSPRFQTPRRSERLKAAKKIKDV